MLKTNKQFNVLYLEDNFEDNHIDLSSIQGQENFIFTLASNCDEARKQIRTTNFDIFILDIEITTSRKSGIQFAEELRTIPQYFSTPIIFVSVHTHYSSSLLSYIKNSTFISKPFNPSFLHDQICLMLNIPGYTKKHYINESLIISTTGNTYIEAKPNDISYIEAIRNNIVIQYINGETLRLSGRYGIFKKIINQISDKNISCLRQIHRSVIININQISDIRIERNTGCVCLFADKKPKPIGIKYRQNLSDFIQEA